MGQSFLARAGVCLAFILTAAAWAQTEPVPAPPVAAEPITEPITEPTTVPTVEVRAPPPTEPPE
ncbi:MAG TPA: mechanosensitive ion channel family protein, partial [Myxococcus sp.]|nr:mechanosensitive ion channel family protein [Myxococcus sp.]